MPTVPIKDYNPGFVNGVTHVLTGAQTLYYLFNAWAEHENLPVILWYRRGEAEFRVNAIRVALSKERKLRGLKRTFELRFSDTWPHTHEGVKGEAIKVERVGGTLQTRVRAALIQMNQQRQVRG